MLRYVKEICKSELTELFRARDASCPKGKKMDYRKSLTARNFRGKMNYLIEIVIFNVVIFTICGFNMAKRGKLGMFSQAVIALPVGLLVMWLSAR